jgi:hypothetical protein
MFMTLSEFVQWYLSVGCAMYVVCFASDALNGFKSFEDVAMIAVLRGLGGILVWPFALYGLRDGVRHLQRQNFKLAARVEYLRFQRESERTVK